jgi:hypothetical protein
LISINFVIAEHGEIYKFYFMATRSGGKRPFPALVIVSLLFLVCLFPGQRLIANLLPGISGLATITPGLTILDIPVHLPVAVDLILVPGLFILIYAIVILLYPSRRPASAWRELLPRIGAILAGSFILVFCMAAGHLLSDLLQDHLPTKIRNGINSLGINADIALPFSTYKPIHLPGNVISLLCLIIGIALFVGKISRTPATKKATPLTREQRMTPYERMLREKKAEGKTRQPAQQSTRQITPQPTSQPMRQPAAKKPRTKTLCHNQPLLTLEPEAVAYMPMR